MYSCTLSKSAQIGNLWAQAVDLGRLRGYLCVVRKILLICLLIFAAASSRAAQTGEVSPTRPAEYMIYQYPDVSLVVSIDAPETEISAEIFGPEGALIKASRVPSRRIGPLYLFVDAVDKPRQLIIKVSPARKIDRSGISLELIQLPPDDRNSKALAQAYKLFSYGTERVHANDTTTWAMKTYTLKNAARAFAELGWEEMQLWAEYFAAHLVLHQLNDVLMSMEMAREIRGAAETAGFEKVEMAALILEGDALMQAAAKASGKSAHARYQQAHEILERVARLAGDLEFHSEQGRALFNNGLAYEQQSQLRKAVEQYQLALEVSVSAGDSELANQIRSSAASAYETLGSTTGAIEMLEGIGTDLASGQTEEAGGELAENQFEKGRILNSSFRYPEAARELSQALRIQQSNPGAGSWGPTGLALAWSHYSMGDTESAASLIQESIPRTTISGNTGALIDAYGNMARIFRYREQYPQMEQYREKQGSLVNTGQQRAGFLFDSAMDAWRRYGPRSNEVRNLLLQTRNVAQASGDAPAEQRAILYLCLLSLESGPGGRCTDNNARQAYEFLRGSGIPELALDASFVWSKIMWRKGNGREALAVMGRVIDEMSLYRLTLPGVLGAWYWENKSQVFGEFMSLSLARSGAGAGKPVDGRLALQSLERIRMIDSVEVALASRDTSADQQDESLRVLLARRKAAVDPEASKLAAEVNDRLEEFRGRSSPVLQPLDAARLDELVTGLKKDEAVLTFYFGKDSIHALSASRDGIYLLQLPGSAKIPDLIQAVQNQITRSDTSFLRDLDELGLLMLKPVARFLAEKTYLVPAGPLIGFPFDALRLDGRFLAENHEVNKLMSLSGLKRRRASLRGDYRDNVFVAGNPQAGQELFTYDIPASAEIDTMTDLFVGPGLHIVQGVALTKDEFRDQRFASASLIHLAIPGRLDLAFPERSRLWMSAHAGDSASTNLAPRDIRELQCTASLLVLSGTGVVAVSRTGYGSRIGIVSDFLESCASPVMATLWPAGDLETAGFISDFYHNLESVGDVGEALANTRRSRIETGDEANIKSWAGFQLYIR